MPVTVSELRTGLQVVDAVLPMKEVLSQSGSSVVQTVISNKAGEEYLFFAAALDSLRSYAAGPKLIPGTYLYNYAKPLIDAMEELDGLIARERAGVPENVDNPYIINDDLRGGLASFAYGLTNAINRKKDDFTLENDDIELLKALDGMVRHLDQSDQVEWRTLKRAIPAMGGPVAMDDSIFDNIQSRWAFKADSRKAEEAIKEQRKEALLSIENGLALQLANSRAAAKADAEIKKADPTAEPSPQGMLYRTFFSTFSSLKKYREKYLDQMKPEDSEALKSCISGFLNAEDALAGPDTHADETGPNMLEAQDIITMDLWPSVVNYFGSYKPDTRVTGEDAVLFRRLYELQEALGLPEKIGECDMRQVYNHVKDIDKKAAPDESVMDDAAVFWNFTRQKRVDEAEARRKLEEERARIKTEEELEAQHQKELQEEADRIAREKADEEARQQKLKEEADRKAKEKADEEARQKKLQEEEERQQKLKEEADRKAMEDAEAAERQRQMKEFVKEQFKDSSVNEDPDLLREFQEIKDALDAEHPERKDQMEERRKQEAEAAAEKEKPLPIPSADGRTWEQYANDIQAYLRQNLKDLPKFGPNADIQRVEQYPHITQILHGLVAINRYVAVGLGDEPVNTQELVSQSRQLMEDPGFKKALTDKFDNQWLASKQYKIFWGHIMDNSRAAYQELSKQQNKPVYSPFEIGVLKTREVLQNSALNAEKPFRNTIRNIVERLDNVQYNSDIQKTGFLFFKPSDTGLFQTAVKALRTINNTSPEETVKNGDKNAAYQAVKAYLDDRKDVRAHEYGKHRWEKMMCAFAALAPKTEFEQYCRDLNAYRKIDNPMDPDYVSPEAFGPGRMDLDNPQITLREARAQVLKEYKEPIPDDAGVKDKDLWYFARIAAMRNSATAQNDWGALIDMKKVNDQAKQLVQDTDFVRLVQSDAFKKGTTTERQSLYQTAAKALAPKKDWTHDKDSVIKGQEEPKAQDELEIIKNI